MFELSQYDPWDMSFVSGSGQVPLPGGGQITISGGTSTGGYPIYYPGGDISGPSGRIEPWFGRPDYWRRDSDNTLLWLLVIGALLFVALR